METLTSDLAFILYLNPTFNLSHITGSSTIYGSCSSSNLNEWCGWSRDGYYYKSYISGSILFSPGRFRFQGTSWWEKEKALDDQAFLSWRTTEKNGWCGKGNKRKLYSSSFANNVISKAGSAGKDNCTLKAPEGTRRIAMMTYIIHISCLCETLRRSERPKAASWWCRDDTATAAGRKTAAVSLRPYLFRARRRRMLLARNHINRL